MWGRRIEEDKERRDIEKGEAEKCDAGLRKDSEGQEKERKMQKDRIRLLRGVTERRERRRYFNWKKLRHVLDFLSNKLLFWATPSPFFMDSFWWTAGGKVTLERGDLYSVFSNQTSGSPWPANGCELNTWSGSCHEAEVISSGCQLQTRLLVSVSLLCNISSSLSFSVHCNYQCEREYARHDR